MKSILNKIGLFSSVAILLLVACSLISGTWMLTYKLVEGKTLIWHDDFYYGSVDYTDEGLWKDHIDKLKSINVIGLELWGQNNSTTDQEYSVYLAKESSTLSGSSTKSEVESNPDAFRILDGLPLTAGGPVFISYGQSLGHIENVSKIKDLLVDGKMKFFAYSDVADPTNVYLDSVNIVITFTAGY